MCRSALVAYELWIYSLVWIYSLSRNSRDPLIGGLEERDHLSLSFSISSDLPASAVIKSMSYNAGQCVTRSPLSPVSLSSSLCSFFQYLAPCLIRALKIKLADSLTDRRRHKVSPTTCVDVTIQSRPSISCVSMLTLM